MEEGEGWVETPEPESEPGGEGEEEMEDDEEGGEGGEEGGEEKEEKEKGEEDDKVPVYAIDCEMVSPPLLCALKRDRGCG